jgi:lipopolysaccharide exporter
VSEPRDASTLADDGERSAEAELIAAAGEGVRWLSLARITTEIVLAASLVVLARLIPPAQFGYYTIALIIQELALTIPAEGVSSALVQRAKVTRAHLETGTFLSFCIGIVLSGLTLLASVTIVPAFLGHEFVPLVQLIAPVCLIGALSSVPMAMLRRRLAFRLLGVIEMSGAVTRALVALVLAGFAGLDGAALVGGTLAGTGLATLIATIGARPPRPRLHRAEMREIRSYGVPAALATISYTGFRNGDYAVIGARLGAAQAGLYWRAFQLAVEYQRKISALMYSVAFPVLARTANEDDLLAMRGRIVRVLAVVLFPLIVGLAITAPEVVPWVYGDQWRAAVLPTQILCGAGAATLLIETIGTSLMASGRPRSLLAYGVVHFVLYIAIVVWVSRWGINAIAIAATVIHGLFVIIGYGILMRGDMRRAFQQLGRDTAPACAACIGLAAACIPTTYLAERQGWGAGAAVAAAIAVSAPSYLLTLRVASPAAWKDLMTLFARLIPPRLVPSRVRGRAIADVPTAS